MTPAWDHLHFLDFESSLRLDEIAVEGVRVHGHHGVFGEEKRDGHVFSVDVIMYVDTRSAGRRDALDCSVSYADAAQIIEDVVSGPSVDLIETLARRIADRITEEHCLVRKVSVTVNKPTAPITQEFSNARVTVHREGASQDAYIALGSNLGDSVAILERALQALHRIPATRVLAASRVFETDPVSDVEQDAYLNAAVLVRTGLSPWQLLDALHRIEHAAHRTREVFWGPRTLDLDLITWGELECADPELTLPHPRACERAFVLEPMLDIDPDVTIPSCGPAASLVQQAADRSGLREGPRIRGYRKSPACEDAPL